MIYCQNIVIADKYKIKVGDVKKLIPNLGSKTLVHYRNLQLYLSLGMKLTKIHRVLKFKQSVWMKKYNDFSTKKRMNAANDFEKDSFKSIIDSVYRKTIEKFTKKNQRAIIKKRKRFSKIH